MPVERKLNHPQWQEVSLAIAPHELSASVAPAGIPFLNSQILGKSIWDAMGWKMLFCKKAEEIQLISWVQEPQISHAGALPCHGTLYSTLPTVLEGRQNPGSHGLPHWHFKRSSHNCFPTFLCTLVLFFLNLSLCLLWFKQDLGQQHGKVWEIPASLPAERVPGIGIPGN